MSDKENNKKEEEKETFFCYAHVKVMIDATSEQEARDIFWEMISPFDDVDYVDIH